MTIRGIDRLGLLGSVLLLGWACLPCSLNACWDDSTWSQFLGPERNGVSSEKGLVDRIDSSTPSEVWRQPMVGGLGGIAVAGNQLFTLAQNDNQQWLVALESQTGKQLWKTALSAAYQNPMGNGPRSTPTLHNGVAYVYTGEGILAAVDAASGKVLWSKDMPKEFSCKPSEYGAACSPLVYESTVVVHVGSSQGAVVAVDTKEGKTLWKAGAGAAGYSSPVLMEIHSKPQVVSLVGNEVLGIDVRSGKTLWKYPFETEFFCNTACPVQVGDSVLISSGENHGSVLLNLAVQSDAWQVKEVWSSFGNNSSLRSEWQTPVLIDGCLFGFDNVGSAGPISHLTCIDATSGKTLWKKARFGKGNLIAADGKLWVSTIDGELVLVKASKVEYQELGRKQILGFTRQVPVIHQGRLYMRDEAEIVCLDCKRP